VPDELLHPVVADWPGGAAEVEAERRRWLAIHPIHGHIRQVREWQVQEVGWRVGR
jgi:hypothetical protein